MRAILNHEILTSTASWTTVQRSADAMVDWFDDRISSGFPVLTAIIDGTLAGYASYGPFRSGQGYARTVEHSIYISENQRGRGIGRSLLSALVTRAEMSGLHVMVGGISGGATASLALHCALGFEVVGRIPEAGEKFGERLDLVFVSRSIGAG